MPLALLLASSPNLRGNPLLCRGPDRDYLGLALASQGREVLVELGAQPAGAVDVLVLLLLFPFRVSIIGSTYGPDTVQIGVSKSGLPEHFKFIKTQYNFRIKNFPYNLPIWTVFDPYMDRKMRNKRERIKTV